MATNWNGYLLKAVKTNKIFPDKYINIESWDSTPKQREELKAYRDDNTRSLTRVTADGMKSKFAFKTRNNLSLEDKIAIQKFFTDAMEEETNPTEAKKQRKVELQYWDDDANKYSKGTFYIPNMNFPIRKITDDTIYYGELTFSFVEY